MMDAMSIQNLENKINTQNGFLNMRYPFFMFIDSGNDRYSV